MFSWKFMGIVVATALLVGCGGVSEDDLLPEDGEIELGPGTDDELGTIDQNLVVCYRKRVGCECKSLTGGYRLCRKKFQKYCCYGSSCRCGSFEVRKCGDPYWTNWSSGISC